MESTEKTIHLIIASRKEWVKLTNKIQVFQTELLQIKNEQMRGLVIKALKKAPEYFWSIPASSTGKYHPSYCLGQGGLVRHTKACVRIASELFRNESVQVYTADEQDLIISALLLHDSCKNGFSGGSYTVTEHPLLVKDLLWEVEPDEEEQELILRLVPLIEPHMGQWNKDFKTGREVLPKPETKIARFVHLCDYLASRKCIEINFNAVG